MNPEPGFMKFKVRALQTDRISMNEWSADGTHNIKSSSS
jgi:hypothetical protein